MHPQMPDADNEYICAAIAEAVDRVTGWGRRRGTETARSPARS